MLAGLRAQRPDHAALPLGDVNRSGRFAFEPSLSPDGTHLAGIAHGDLFLLELASGQARFVTRGTGSVSFPSFSPKGDRIGFVRDGDLHWVELDGSREVRLTDRGGVETRLNGVCDWVYEEELELRLSYWWSPDGQRLAYFQFDTAAIPVFPITDEMEPIAALERQRYPKAGGANSLVRLGVISSAGGDTRWVSPGRAADGYLARAGWLPDGGAVWYQWLNREQTRLELRAVDPGGRSRTLLVEQDPAWVNVRDDLTFVDGERFVWSSERDGWRHLYLYDLNGRELRRLTRGSWQVERVYGVGDGGRVFFEATEKDPRERHLYRVSLRGGAVERISPEDGTHAALLAPGGRHLADTWSRLDAPPRIELRDASGARLRTLATGHIPGLAKHQPLPPVELGEIRAEDGERLFTALVRPPALAPGRRAPVLIYVYGGPHAQTVRNAWGDRARLFFQYLAQRGLAVFWMDNRGSWGRGHAFEAAIHRRLGEVELQDQLAGVRWLKRQPWVDPDRIGLYGGSYGGYMTLELLLAAPDEFRAGVAAAPVTDWSLYDTIYTERYMDHPRDNPQGYRASAVLERAERLAAPLLLVHGTMDNNVHVQHSLQLVDRLARAGKPFRLVTYPRARHGLSRSAHRLHYHRTTADFLLEHLPPAR